MTRSSLGWSDFFAHHYQPFCCNPSLVPARVALEHRRSYHLFSALGEFTAECTGRLLHQTPHAADLPAVGDWVVMSPRVGELRADIHAILPRHTAFSRRSAGRATNEQLVAANVDTVFLVAALDPHFSLRRIERYLVVARESGATPVIILSKSDLHPSPDTARQTVEPVAGGAAIVALSARESPDSLTAVLQPWLAPGNTVAVVGPSGVGKSTLVNRLLGADCLATSEVSASHGKGRHTTTRRELVMMSSGALLIDTPGMRELQLWQVSPESLDETFADIARIAARCRFSDCHHEGDAGCAIHAALERGELDESRWASYQKLQREQAYAARKQNPEAARATKRAWKKINVEQRARRQQERED